MSVKDDIKRASLQQYQMKKCKCGHSVLFVTDKKICSHCGNYVFKNKKVEFEYRMKEKLKK